MLSRSVRCLYGFIQYRAVYKYDVCKCIFPFHISWVTERNCKVNGNLKTFTQKTSANKHVKVVDLCNCIAIRYLMIFSSIELNNKTLNVARAKNAISLNASLNLFRCDANAIADCRLQVALHVMLATIRRSKECSRTSPRYELRAPRHGNLVLFIICVFALLFYLFGMRFCCVSSMCFAFNHHFICIALSPVAAVHTCSHVCR